MRRGCRDHLNTHLNTTRTRARRDSLGGQCNPGAWGALFSPGPACYGSRHSHRADRISFSRFGDSVPRNPFSVAA